MKDAPMSREDARARRDDIVSRWGAWRVDNLRLADGLFTIGDGAPAGELRLRRTMQHLRDLAGGTLSGLRVLDLGSGEGGLALEMAKNGADVVALDGRLGQIEKGEFAQEALGVRTVSFVRADVRHLSVEEHGFFDVVVAMSILDRLDAPDVFEVARRIGAVCKRFALVEVRLAPRARAGREHDGVVFRGAPRREHAATSSRAQRLAAQERSLDNDLAFLLTRASMLRLLSTAGFTSFAEMLHPESDEHAPWLAAFKGRRVSLATAPQANAAPSAEWGDPPAARRGSVGGLLRRRKR